VFTTPFATARAPQPGKLLRPLNAGITVAVNFWWQSALTSALREQPHCRFYHLRVVMGEALGGMIDQLVENCPAADLSRLGANCAAAEPSGLEEQGQQQGQQQEQQQKLNVQQSHHHHQQQQQCQQLSSGEKGTEVAAPPRGLALSLTPREAAAVHIIVQLLLPPKIRSDASCLQACDVDGLDNRNSCNPLRLPSDPLSCLLRALDTIELVHCLYEISQRHPHIVQTMFDVHMTPMAAYILTLKLEAAEQERVFPDLQRIEQSENEEVQQMAPGGSPAEGMQCLPVAHISQAQFYCSLYGACKDADKVQTLSACLCLLIYERISAC